MRHERVSVHAPPLGVCNAQTSPEPDAAARVPQTHLFIDGTRHGAGLTVRGPLEGNPGRVCGLERRHHRRLSRAPAGLDRDKCPKELEKFLGPSKSAGIGVAGQPGGLWNIAGTSNPEHEITATVVRAATPCRRPNRASSSIGLNAPLAFTETFQTHDPWS